MPAVARPLRWLLVLAWMAVIFWFSAQTDSGEQSSLLTRAILALFGSLPDATTLEVAEHLLRKLAHFGEYAVLAALLAFALPGDPPRRVLIAWLLATGYAATDELHQAFVPKRGPSLSDVAIDSMGALAGAAAFAFACAARLTWRVR